MTRFVSFTNNAFFFEIFLIFNSFGGMILLCILECQATRVLRNLLVFRYTMQPKLIVKRKEVEYTWVVTLILLSFSASCLTGLM